MKMIKVAFFALLVAGCASNAYVQDVNKPNGMSLAPYDRVYVEVKGQDQGIESRKGFDINKTELEKAFIADLTAKNKFGTVTRIPQEEPEADSITISLIIEDLNYLSGASSVMFGIMSGNARLKVLARITDRKSGEVLAEIRSGSQTKSSGGIFRGSSSTLIEQVSAQLATEVASLK